LAERKGKAVRIEDENRTLPADASNDKRPDGRVQFQLVGGRWNSLKVTLYPPFDQPFIIGDEVYALAPPINKRGNKYVYQFRGSRLPDQDSD